MVIGCFKTTNTRTGSGLRHCHRRIDTRIEEEHDKSGISVEKGLELGERVHQENR
jgi:hypothetical protein